MAEERTDWISVKDKLPTKGQRVLAISQFSYDFGRLKVEYKQFIAEYVARKTLLSDEFFTSDSQDIYDCTEYDKDDNKFWVKEQWYESITESENKYIVSGEVIAWRPLQEMPKSFQKEYWWEE